MAHTLFENKVIEAKATDLLTTSVQAYKSVCRAGLFLQRYE